MAAGASGTPLRPPHLLCGTRRAAAVDVLDFRGGCCAADFDYLPDRFLGFLPGGGGSDFSDAHGHESDIADLRGSVAADPPVVRPRDFSGEDQFGHSGHERNFRFDHGAASRDHRSDWDRDDIMNYPTPLGELCVIRPESLDGLVQTLDPRKAFRGRIITCGPGRPLPDGSSAPMEVKAGDIVRIKQGNAIEGIYSGIRIWIVRESDLLAVE